MYLNIILEWSTAALAVAGLIVFIRLRNKNRDKKNLIPLLLFARENNSEISYSDAWSKTLIGIDNKEINSAFFIRNIPGNEIREKINLSEVTECTMFKTERKVKNNKETVNVIDRIELIFSFYNHKPQLSLEFYNTDYDQLSLSGELQLAQKWTGILKSVISVNQNWKAKEPRRQFVKPQVSKSLIANDRIKNRPVVNEHAF